MSDRPTPHFPVLDVHHHVGDAFAALGGRIDGTAAQAGITRDEYPAVELAARLEIMDRGGVDRAIVIPGHGYERPNGIADTRAENDKIAAYRDARPDRFPVAVGIVEPRDGGLGIEEIDRAQRELDLRGISFHTRFQGVSLDNGWVLRAVERLGELGMVPVLHAMNDTPEEALWKLAAVARAHPDVPILALDAFGGYEATRQCFQVAEIARNIVFDTSLSYNFDFIEDFARAFGPERVAFGTDLYSHPVGKRISHILAQILESSLDDAAKQAILAGNAERLFGVAASD